MKETAVKICGLQSVEVLKSMINLPVDYVGFVFARSKRQVSSEQAAELLSLLQYWSNGAAPQSVGVFLNPSPDELENVLRAAPLDVVQLHGTEDPAFCQDVKDRFGVRVLKAFSVKEDGSVHGKLDLDAYAGLLDGLLLDTYDPKYGGGSGHSFNWRAVNPYRDWAMAQGIPLFVAGGLHSDNVELLIETLQPDGVDVSSGVETAGVKDPIKIAEFIERVKGR
ncbi:phosphoribosylanthranilate isomerase [Paenibacillus sanguinis]|uniref:phosphoribosylanthranilate isomerase n=1 Tax=Paenibacillus sanguinis TaxID=225906 RepID=UPI00037841CE|nr:phosphoribosylanthranilate isomerase [Paenibacillus sanguinis]